MRSRRASSRKPFGFYSDVIDRDGQHYEAYLERGRVHLDLGDYGRAMSDFTVANDIHPDNPHTGVALADLFFARKEYSRAVEFYTDALRELPEHAMAICRRGYLLLLQTELRRGAH